MNVQHERNGELLSYRWGAFHADFFQQVVFWERNHRNMNWEVMRDRKHPDSDKEFQLWCDCTKNTTTIATDDYTTTDKTDGEVVTVLKGDIVRFF